MPTRNSHSAEVNPGQAHGRPGINPWATRLAILAYLIVVGGSNNSQTSGAEIAASRSTYSSMLSRKPNGNFLSQCEFTSVRIVKTHCLWIEKGQWSPCRLQIIDREGNELFYQQVDSMTARKYQTAHPLITIPDALGSRLTLVRQEIGDIALGPPYSVPSPNLEQAFLYKALRNTRNKWLGYSVYWYNANESNIRLLKTFLHSEGHKGYDFRVGGWSTSNRFVSFGDNFGAHIFDTQSDTMYSIKSTGRLIPASLSKSSFLMYDSLNSKYKLVDFFGSVIDSLPYDGRQVIPNSAYIYSESCVFVLCHEPYNLLEELLKGALNGYGLYLLDFSARSIRRLRESSGDSHIIEVISETDTDVH